MNRDILNQAFITMGYQSMPSHNMGNVFGKPVGFGIIIARINKNHKEIEFKSLIRSIQGETLIWKSKIIDIDYTNPKTGYETIEGEELYNCYIDMIAYAECECHVDKIIYKMCREKGPFAFKTRNDVMSLFNI